MGTRVADVLEWFGTVPGIYYLSGISAGLGGLAAFLFACKKGHIKNNRHCRKATLEVVGGAIVGFFLSLATAAAGAQELWRAVTAFIGGIGWAYIVELVRKKITDVAEALFFGARSGGQKEEESRQCLFGF